MTIPRSPYLSKKRRTHDVGIDALTLDPRNANRGTERGRSALARSLREYGPGRSVLIDKHGTVISGNKTVEQARQQNIPLRVIATDGRCLVAVQRTDLDLSTDARAQALAFADNRVGELDLEWDVDMLKQIHAAGVDLSAFWTPEWPCPGRRYGSMPAQSRDSARRCSHGHAAARGLGKPAPGIGRDRSPGRRRNDPRQRRDIA